MGIWDFAAAHPAWFFACVSVVVGGPSFICYTIIRRSTIIDK